MLLESYFPDYDHPACKRCRGQNQLDLQLRMAFQPIFDIRDGSVHAYEALVRGPNGESAASVIAGLTDEQLYRFDQTCRVHAVFTAAKLGLATLLSINFMPNAVYEPATCIRLTLEAARRAQFPAERLMFEMTEGERMRDSDHALRIIRDYKSRGFITAIDDFGAGYAGLNLLVEFQPDALKLDMALVRGIDGDPVRRAIVGGVMHTANALGCNVVAEGVETPAELHALRDLGIHLIQGFLLARPGLETLPTMSDAGRIALRDQTA